MGKYRRRKISLLQQLGVTITQEILQHISRLVSEIAVDNYIRKLTENKI